MIKYNENIILIKTGFFIKITKPNNYKKSKCCLYEHLINKLIYFVHNLKPDIIFAISHLCKYNFNLKKAILSYKNHSLVFKKNNAARISI